MFDHKLRELKERLCTPLVHVLASLGCTATQLTLVGFGVGLLSALCAALRFRLACALLWWLNRLLDGLDGALARHTRTCSLLGAYIDILCDFTVYALLPCGLVVGQLGLLTPSSLHAGVATASVLSQSPHELDMNPASLVSALLGNLWLQVSPNVLWLLLALLLVSYFVNAAGLFMLAAALEQLQHGAPSTGEFTSVTMPSGLVEGLETALVYGLMTSFPESLPLAFALFTVGVTCTILQRLIWAWNVLPDLETALHQRQRTKRS